MRQPALPQGLPALQARRHQPDAAEHEVGARAPRDAHHLLAVDGHIVAQHAEAEAESHHVEAEKPATHEEETVPRELRLVAHNLLLRKTDRRVDPPPYAGHDEGYPEEQLEAVGNLIKEDADGRGDGHREIVAQTVIADALSAATGGQHIDGCRRVGHRQSTEGAAVERPDDRKQ